MPVCSCGLFFELSSGFRSPLREITSPWRTIFGWATATHFYIVQFDIFIILTLFFRLMVVDPYEPERGIFTAFFSIPSSCSCGLDKDKGTKHPFETTTENPASKNFGKFCSELLKNDLHSYFYTTYRYEGKWFPIFENILRVWEN